MRLGAGDAADASSVTCSCLLVFYGDGLLRFVSDLFSFIVYDVNVMETLMGDFLFLFGA